jgi:hypothetical protein
MNIYILFIRFYERKIAPVFYLRKYALEFCKRKVWFTSDEKSVFLHERILEILGYITKKSSPKGGFFTEKSIR